ncbi:MAG: acyltransferase [Anaerobacillus sp.]
MKKTSHGQSEIYFLSAITCLFILLVQVSGMFSFSEGQLLTDITPLTYQISQLGIAMFAVIIGLYLFNQQRMNGKEKRFNSSRFFKLALLFVVWSIFYLALTKMLTGGKIFTGWEIGLADVAMGNSFYHLYFVSAVLQFLLISPVLKLVRSKMGWSLLLVVAAIVNYTFLSIYSPGTSTISTILEQQGSLTNWIFFFIYGGFLAYHWENVQRLAKKLNWLGFVTLIGLIGFTAFSYQGSSLLAQSGWMMIAIPLMTISLLAIYESVKKVILLDLFLAAIGKSAGGIYLVFPLVIVVYSNILPESMFGGEYFVLVFSLVLGTSVFASRVMELFPVRYEGKRFRVSDSYMMNHNSAWHHPNYSR